MPVTEAEVWEALRWAEENAQDSYILQHAAYGVGQNGSPAAFHLACAIANAAATCPLNLELTGIRGEPHFPHLWMMLLGPQGEKGRKTQAIRLAKRLLLEAAPDLVCSPAGSPQEQKDSFADEAKPVQLIFAAEGGSFFAASKGSQNMADYKPVLTELYDGDMVHRNTKKTKVTISRPRPSLLVGINPTYLSQHAEADDWDNGFISRFGLIYALPEREIKVPKEGPNGGAWSWLTQWLYQARTILEAGLCIGLTADAYDRYFSWSDDYQSLKVPGPSPYVHTRGGNLALKVALAFGWSCRYGHDGKPWKITLPCLELGIRIAEWHYRSLCDISAEIVTTPEMRDRRTVLRVIEGPPKGTWLSLGQIIKEARLLKTRGKLILDTLVEERTIEALRMDEKGGQGNYYRIPPEPLEFSTLPNGVNLTIDLSTLPPLPPIPPG